MPFNHYYQRELSAQRPLKRFAGRCPALARTLDGTP